MNVKPILIACFSITVCCTSLLGADYDTTMRIRQLELKQRMDEIQRDMKQQTDSAMSSVSENSRPAYPPALPDYRQSPLISATQVQVYQDRLGDPDKKTGIYAYPPAERLYQYGRMCLEIGLAAEGIRAISEHLRIEAEIAAQKSTEP